jgi:threonine dehydratase
MSTETQTRTTVTLDDIHAAAARITGQVVRTPLRFAPHLSALTGAEVWVKYENQQYTSSFKERGALNTLLQLDPAQRKVGVIAMSAGNHAQGLAYHAMRLGIPATIVMPAASPIVKVMQTRKHGAEVVLHGDVLEDSMAKAREIATARGLTFVHPFDQAPIIAGQGTVALEMLVDKPDLDTLIIPIGGGGLIAGNAIAAKGIKPGITVIGVETALYPSFHARRAGQPSVCGGATLAEGIAVKAIGELPFALANHLIDDVVVVEEALIEHAVYLYAHMEKTVAEGAGASPLSVLLKHPERFAGQTVGLILCGGNIDTRLLSEVLLRGLERDGRLMFIRVAGMDQPGLLAKLTRAIADAGGNIQDLHHNRLALDLPAKWTEVSISFEARDRAHGADVITAIEAAGFTLRA